MEIRPATSGDAQAIRNVLLRAFPTPVEVDLVERLESDGDAVVSLIADDNGVVGHVLLSRMNVEADARPLQALGLAPVAVLPERQGQGLGRP